MQNNGKNATLWPGGAFLHRGSIVEFHRVFDAAVEAAEAVHIIQVTYRAMNCNATALCLCRNKGLTGFPSHQTGEGQAAPRPESSLRGGQGRLRQGGLALGGGWGLAGLADLEPQSPDKVVNVKGNGLDKAVQHILRY